jgi:4-aminobutyrate aminotransferase
MMPCAYHVPYAYCFRCAYKLKYPDCGLWCLDFIEEIVFKKIIPPEEVAGIIVEPIQGAGGYIVPPDEFLPKLKKLCEKYGIILIDDEVQTGFGRTGKMWACEHWKVIPEILCASKAIAAGLPMGICVTKSEIMDWGPTSHENTLGGNPIIVSAALAVLDVLISERLIENAEKIGSYLMKRLKELQEKYEIIGDVRGKGMMIGVEFVKDRKSLEPAEKERDKIILEAFKKGLLLLGAGRSSLRLAPPLILDKEQADKGIEIFEEALKKI